MNPQVVTQWLRSKENRRYGVLEEHTLVFEALFSSTLSPLEAAMKFDSQVNSSKYTDAAWRFRQILFALAAEYHHLHTQLLQLVEAINLIPPRPEKCNSLDSGLQSDWRDVHDSLWSMRMQPASARDGLPPSAGIIGAGAERFNNFVALSAKLVRGDLDQGGIRELAFFDIRDALETRIDKRQLPPNCILSDQQLKAVDIEIAATWILQGQQCILCLRNEDFSPGWEAGLAKKTDLWNGGPGLSAERWKLWADELSRCTGLPSAGAFDETKATALQAAELIYQQQERSPKR